MIYRVDFLPRADRQFRKLPHSAQQGVRDVIEALAHTPRPPKAKQLSGPEGWLRVRVGDYRIVYAVEDAVLVVLVVAVGHRREVYRRQR